MWTGETVTFTRMSEGTKADYDLLERAGRPYFAGVADRLLGVLESMREVFVGYQVSSLEHLLQTASRAERDGADDEMIVAALLHDIGDVFAPENHSQFAASLLRPYVREEVHWIVRHHGIFQLYYSGAHQGRNPDLRERYRDSPHYEACATFCERWDQRSFDPPIAARRWSISLLWYGGSSAGSPPTRPRPGAAALDTWQAPAGPP